MRRLVNFTKLDPFFLFSEVERRKNKFLNSVPEADIISLGIGDTVLPLTHSIAQAMAGAASDLSSREDYSGYGADQGLLALRELLSDRVYHGEVASDEIFISDGAKCDVGRLQMLFSNARSVGVQNPSYPPYLDGSLIHGIKKIHPLFCTPKNNFFPSLPKRLDLLYICNPNNPTGAVYTHDQLRKLVDYAEKVGAIILFDGAYSAYIQDFSLPKSIYEIEGARDVAIEVNSFSKMVGFSGVRLGWTIIPKNLKFECGHPIWNDWHRLNCTIFNGASHIAQSGGVAVFESEEWRKNIAYYMENAYLLKSALKRLNYSVYGGENAPYLWIHIPGNSSWESFQYFLEKKHIIVTPGVGYGSSGENFVRMSSFAYRHQIMEVIDRVNE